MKGRRGLRLDAQERYELAKKIMDADWMDTIDQVVIENQITVSEERHKRIRENANCDGAGIGMRGKPL